MTLRIPKRALRTLPPPPPQPPSSGAPPPGGIFAARIHPNGRHVLSGGADRTVHVRNLHTGLHVHSLAPLAHQVVSLAISADGSRLLSCAADPFVHIHALASPSCKQTLKLRAHAIRTNAVAFAGAADSLALTAGYDAVLSLWDLRARTRTPVQSMRDARDAVTAVEAATSPPLVFAASVDGNVRTYDLRNATRACDMLAAPVAALRLTRDANCLLATCLSSRLLLLDHSSGELLARYSGHSNTAFPLGAAVSHDDAFIVAGSEDGALYFWDIVDGEQPLHVNAPPPASLPSVVSAVDAHPTEDLVVSATHAGVLTVWGI